MLVTPAQVGRLLDGLTKRERAEVCAIINHERTRWSSFAEPPTGANVAALRALYIYGIALNRAHQSRGDAFDLRERVPSIKVFAKALAFLSNTNAHVVDLNVYAAACAKRGAA
jgi:hypothetical protein